MTKDELINHSRNILGYSERMTRDIIAAYDLGAAAEREACANACESVHIRPIQGAHEAYMEGKEMAIAQCARAIRMRSN